ncbi:unnamed protein product [Penicillium glandicola]
MTETADAARVSDLQVLMIGIFAKAYLLDEKTVRKVPRGKSEEDMQPVIREAMIYDTIGVHPRIAECILRGSDVIEFVDIKFYRHGDLATYCQKNIITSELQLKWFKQILEAVVVIHSFGVIHSDLALRQFFVDDKLDLRLGDFNSSQCPGYPALGYEKASHCLPRDYELPNTESSDIFALGSTLYELVAGKAPYAELNVADSDDPESIKAQIRRQHQVIDFEIEERYKRHQFPDISNDQHGHIILGCWRSQFATAREVLDTAITFVVGKRIVQLGTLHTMPPLNDSAQHERMLTTLRRRIRDLRSEPNSRSLVIARLNAISRLARICAQLGRDACFTRFCDILQRGLPGQIGLLKSNVNSNFIVADALDRMIIEASLFPPPAANGDRDNENAGEELRQQVDSDASDEESDMDSSDDDYIARLLLGSKWAEPIVDFVEEPYGEIEASATDASEEESEIDSSDDDYIARLLLGPSWATPIADFVEESYGVKEAQGG